MYSRTHMLELRSFGWQVKRFGAVATVTLTSVRKVVTIYVSFMLFPKPYSHAYLLGTALILFGIGMNLYRKSRDEIRQAFASCRRLLRSRCTSSPALTRSTTQRALCSLEAVMSVTHF